MNGVIMQYFHWYYPANGKLWEDFAGNAARIKEMGFTAVWLPPAYKCSKGINGTGYDCYDLYDLGEFDQKGSVPTRFGTRQSYLDAIAAAHAQEIAVYADIVLNHRMGADHAEKVRIQEIDSDNRTQKKGEPFDAEINTYFDFPGRNGQYSQFIWDYRCFSGVDLATTDDGQEKKGIFKILNEYGDDWEQDVGKQFGNFDYVMGADVEFRNPHVKEEMKNWIRWYFETCGIDGLRLDALKHISAGFQKEWLDFIRQEIKNDLFAVGEYWTGKPELLNGFLEQMGDRLSLFDVPLHYKFHEAGQKGKDFDLRQVFDDTLVAAHPMQAVTFVENHDTQPLQALESAVSDWFKPHAYALILLTEQGYPCVFYADLFGASYSDKDSGGHEHQVDLPAVALLPALLKARSLYAYGAQTNLFDHPNCIGWYRKGDAEHKGCVVIISNSEDGHKDISLDESLANQVFYDFVGNRKEEVVLDGNAHGRFTVNGRSVSVWVQKD